MKKKIFNIKLMIILHVHNEMSNQNSSQEAMRNASINRCGGCYSQGRKYSPSRIAECIDSFHMFVIANDRNPTVTEFMEVSKISKRSLAINIMNCAKYGTEFPCVAQGHGHVGPLSIVDPTGEIRLELYLLYLQWRSRPLRSYKVNMLHKFNVNISFETIRNWFTNNNRHNGVFVSRKCTFSDLKYTESNVLYYRQYLHKFSLIYHSNVSFTDEKAFIVHDLLKLRVRRDPITGEIPELLHCHDTNTRKRCNIMCSIRPFKVMTCNKALVCVITAENGTAELCQKHLKLKLRIGFIKKGT